MNSSTKIAEICVKLQSFQNEVSNFGNKVCNLLRNNLAGTTNQNQDFGNQK